MHDEGSLPPEFRSATSLLALMRERKLGALELLDLQLARASRENPKLNAIVAMDVERARANARAADSVAPSMRGPLHGLPITIKDAYEVVGLAATCGFPDLATHRPSRDADAVARLRAAGAIPFGKDECAARGGGSSKLQPRLRDDQAIPGM